MKILLVTATLAEMSVIPVAGLAAELLKKGITVHALVTKPGITSTSYALGREFALHRYDLAINAGIAGSFSKAIIPGTTVQIKQEILADFGAEDGDGFLSAFHIGLFNVDEFPFSKGALNNTHRFQNPALNSLMTVNGITVNTVHGNDNSIKRTLALYDADIESMEGAAFFYACIVNEIPFFEIRSVSNYVEKRDREAWKVQEALSSMGSAMEKILLSL